MTFKIKSEEGDARAGILELPSGKKLKTPFFMPVMTKGVAKNVTQDMLLEAGTQCGISNSFVLTLKPGVDFIKKAGGLHKLAAWEGGYFTDSGGFQMLSKQFFRKINDEAVIFMDPFSGKKYSLSPEECMDNQLNIGSDVAMALDHVPSFYGMTEKKMKEHLRRTHLWAERCKKYHDENSEKKQLLFGISQGGAYPDLRKESASYINSLDFDGIAFGGFCFGESDSAMYEGIEISKRECSKDKPIYVMGMGNPIQILNAVALGCDIFDSTFPTMNGRNGTLFTQNGLLRIKRSEYRHDLRSIEESCDCYACKNYSRAYIRYLLDMNENLGKTLATIHNIRFIHKLLEDARESILNGSFEDFKRKIIQAYDKKDDNIFKYGV
ncbi:MAG: tRNA guanosine(34) transglycosylase Tgt [Nanobdellota archaeon]